MHQGVGIISWKKLTKLTDDDLTGVTSALATRIWKQRLFKLIVGGWTSQQRAKVDDYCLSLIQARIITIESFVKDKGGMYHDA